MSALDEAITGCGYYGNIGIADQARAELARLRKIESALALAGIPPAALAADTECVRKLVEAASDAAKCARAAGHLLPAIEKLLNELGVQR